MSPTVFIPEFDEVQLRTGYLWATKVDDKGPQRGLMPVSEVADTMREFINWEAGRRQVKMISRFEESPFLGWGQNGAQWMAVKAIEPAEYHLLSVSGKAYPVRLPRLIAKVGSHIATYLFWTDAEQITFTTRVYPLIIGNIDHRGWVCMGTSGLKCLNPDDIDSYVHQVVEVPATGTYLPDKTNMDKLFEALTQEWDHSIGKKHGITLAKLLALTE